MGGKQKLGFSFKTIAVQFLLIALTGTDEETTKSLSVSQLEELLKATDGASVAIDIENFLTGNFDIPEIGASTSKECDLNMGRCPDGRPCCPGPQNGFICCNEAWACIPGCGCCPTRQVCGAICCPFAHYCCAGGCCPDWSTCCGSACCPLGFYCCSGACCPQDNTCCGGACCRPGFYCCAGSCCPHGHNCCGASCCAVGFYCCAGSCCPVGNSCCGAACCVLGHKCCFGTCCLEGKLCCGGTCCPPGKICCDSTCCAEENCQKVKNIPDIFTCKVPSL